MRLRNVKNKEEIISKSNYIIKDYNSNKGKWNKLFNNNNPLCIEIGMGKGDFIIAKALNNPNMNYIGIEKYESVIVRAIQKLFDIEIPNLKLICMDAKDIEEVFDKEVDIIYLNFSDPWPKKRHTERRLTSSTFLNRYKNIVKKDLIIEMKTDNDLLFDYSLIEFQNNNFILEKVNRDYGNNINNIEKTEYEKKFIEKGKNINYVKAILKK